MVKIEAKEIGVSPEPKRESLVVAFLEKFRSYVEETFGQGQITSSEAVKVLNLKGDLDGQMGWKILEGFIRIGVIVPEFRIKGKTKAYFWDPHSLAVCELLIILWDKGRELKKIVKTVKPFLEETPLYDKRLFPPNFGGGAPKKQKLPDDDP